MTPTSNNQFTAYVDHFNADKGFGFAVGPGGQKVFFHMSACRLMENGRFTDRRSDEQPKWSRGCRYPSKIIVQVAAGPKGLKATRWGHTPTWHWMDELHDSNTFASFAGGHVEITYSDRQFGHVTRESKGPLNAAPELTRADDAGWWLQFSYTLYEGDSGRYGDPTGTADFEFAMADASQCKPLSSGKYALDVRLGERNWAHVVFFPQGWWKND